MLVNGREIAQHILDNLKIRVGKLYHEHGIVPHLAVVRVGNDPAISSYVNQKKITAEKIGAKVSIFQFDTSVTEKELLKKLQELDNDSQFHGVIAQLPVPKHINENTLTNIITPMKDVDGFNLMSRFYVPLAMAVIAVLQDIHFQKDPLEEVSFINWLKTRNIVVIGKGKTGGQPVIDLLHKMKLNPNITDSKTKNVKKIMQEADIIVSAVGKPGIITSQNIKQDVILISVGINRDNEGKIHGDYDVEEIKDIAGFYTPVPGGVGPVNVAKLMENVVIAAENFARTSNAGRDLRRA